MTIVWVVESGDYEARGIDNIYSTHASAIEGVKAEYPPPYKVSWELVEWGVLGHFERVDGFSTRSTSTFEITPYEVME